jgi:hypothetical protein
MNCADTRRFGLAGLLLWCAALLAACGGSSTEVTYSGPGLEPGSAPVAEAIQAEPAGPNTVEIVVDKGPTGLGAGSTVNIPYVTVTVCEPGSTTQCVTVDHVIVDTGSYGLRLLRSKVQPALNLPAVQLVNGAVAGPAVECYPFIIGGLWGPLARAEVAIGGERTVATATRPADVSIQLIDDLDTAVLAAPADCVQAANGAVLKSAHDLQANGILGLGGVSIDCGTDCVLGNYEGRHVQYYLCPDNQVANCVPAPISLEQQVQNPVIRFAENNNGTIISLPSLPTLGAGTVKGRLVFGIATQTNNQLTNAAQSRQVWLDTNTANDLTYLYFTTTVDARSYPQSFIDSGSNALFFNDGAVSQACEVNAGASGAGWYCPVGALTRQATFTSATGATATADFSVGSADALFRTASMGFANLAGAVPKSTDPAVVDTSDQVFVWGLPFFYGRSVYTSIWKQALSASGPWYAYCDLKGGQPCPGAP